MSGKHGGRRAGAGRKRKDSLLRSIEGGRFRGQATPPTLVVPVETFAAPDDLPADERAVWLELAPHAFTARTLTKGTAFAFVLLCRSIVSVGRLSVEAGGPNHRGMLREVQTRLLQFNLAPCGKALYESEPVTVPVNPLSKFRRG